MEKQARPRTPADEANEEAVKLWRRCRHDEAVELLEAFLAAGHALTSAELLRTLSTKGMIERARGQLQKSLAAYRRAAPLADARGGLDPTLCGKFHNGHGITLQELGDADGAIIEFTAAGVFYERAGEYRKQADVENNLAVLHAEAGRVAEAREHVARAVGSCPADEAVLAQVEDTQALIALAAGDTGAALDFANSSVTRLRRLAEPHLLAKSLRTQERANRAHQRAVECGRIRGALEACEWNLTRAARGLGFNSRQALEYHLREHCPELDEERRKISFASKPAN